MENHFLIQQVPATSGVALGQRKVILYVDAVGRSICSLLGHLIFVDRMVEMDVVLSHPQKAAAQWL